MGAYAVTDLVKDIKIILDRNQESASLVPDDTDTLSQGELIESKIEDAARLVLSEAPPQLIDGAANSTLATSWRISYGFYVGSAKLPPDLMRILSVRASDWARPGKLITENDEEYKLQSCRFGVRGNPERPVAAIVNKEGDRYLELYTSGTGRAAVSLSYVKLPVISSGSITLPQTLADAVRYMAAYLVCVSLGDSETASVLKSVACGLAGIAVAEPSQTQ